MSEHLDVIEARGTGIGCGAGPHERCICSDLKTIRACLVCGGDHGLYGACDRSGFSNRREPTVSVTSPLTACPYCGNPHVLERCPRIKSIEYHAMGGGIKKLEFFEPSPLRSYAPRYDAKPPDHLFDTEHATADFWPSPPSQARRNWPAQIQLCPETLRAIVTAFGGDPLKVGDRTEWTASHCGNGKY